MLEDEGHEVRKAHSAEQVREALADWTPDAVVLDIAMPGMSGYELGRALRLTEKGRDALLVGITGKYPREADRLRAAPIGFDHYFVKPVAPVEIVSVLARRAARYPASALTERSTASGAAWWTMCPASGISR